MFRDQKAFDVIQHAHPIEGVSTFDGDDRKPIYTKKQWEEIDLAVQRGCERSFHFVGELLKAGVVYEPVGDLWKKMFFLPAEAEEVTTDPEILAKASYPLPFIWKEVQVSTHRPVHDDFVIYEAAGRRVGDMCEQITLGVQEEKPIMDKVFGLCNFPQRGVFVLQKPTEEGWNSAMLVLDVLHMKKALQNNKHYGDYWLLHSRTWDPYMDDDYCPSKTGQTFAFETLRQRILQIDGVKQAFACKGLKDWDMVLVQPTPDVVRMVIALRPVAVQWTNDSVVVMMCIVPQLRANFYGDSGIIHASVQK